MISDYEKTLIKKAKKGNIKAFEKLIVKHEKIAYNTAYRLFNNEEDAKDITQEAFIKVFKNIKNFNESSSFSTWIYRIVTNTCLDEMRKRKGKETESLDENIEMEDSSIKKDVEDVSTDLEKNIIEKEEKQEIHNAIHSLKEDYKTVIILKDIQGFKYDEISKILECSVSTVKTRVRRGRNNLKEILYNSKLFSEDNRLNNRKEDKI